MTLLIVSIIVSIVAVIAILCGVAYANQKAKYKVSKSRYALSIFGLFGMLILLFGMFTRVEANQVGIIYDELNGGVQDDTYGEGLHVKSIFENIIQISTANRSSKVVTTGQTNDGQYATFELSLIYKIEKENAGKFYRITNDVDIPIDALNTLVKSCLQSSTINYDIFALLSTGLETARLDFKDDLKNTLFETYYITLVDVSFDEIDGGTEVETILQQKAEALQKIDIAELEAEADLISATNQAEIQKTLADAAAYAVRVEGEANGEAASAYVAKIQGMIDNLNENLNGAMSYEECADLVLSIIFYDTWDGELPEVLTSDSLSSMIGGMINSGNNSSNSSNESTGA
jgi:regulator of protease activity HflC (stomatin/prohibitin superfamily)